MYTFGAKLKRRRTYSREERREKRADSSRRSAAEGGFQETLVADIPEVARRWFLHAIQPGTPLATRVDLRMTGSIRPDPKQGWYNLTARQTLAPPLSFTWTAGARRGLRWMRAEDRFALGAGQMRLTLFGILPVLNVSGPQVSQSALGRMMIESIWIPTALLPQRGVLWEGVNDQQARASLTVHGTPLTLTLGLDAAGRLTEVFLQRLGNVRSGEWEFLPYGARIEEECPFHGFTIPSVIRGGWMYGTPEYEESIRLSIDEAVFS